LRQVDCDVFVLHLNKLFTHDVLFAVVRRHGVRLRCILGLSDQHTRSSQGSGVSCPLGLSAGGEQHARVDRERGHAQDRHRRQRHERHRRAALIPHRLHHY
jgi:hypothetical protein